MKHQIRKKGYIAWQKMNREAQWRGKKGVTSSRRQTDLNRRYKRSNEIEKLGVACLTERIIDELRRTRRAEQLKNSNKKKAKNRANFIKNPHNYTKTLLGGERTGHLHFSKEEVEQYLYETTSHKEREIPLGYYPRVEEEQPTIDFETKEPT
ncbi:unnamed protein product [Mytilus coruscus]|uniref:Uncharacterized protein n=1 Tax=Mytilus coruscus TaxID=42192 RepID=A0A6J8A296_MYTCO|nr:unnamed protein product [Mytilus coruscus]